MNTIYDHPPPNPTRYMKYSKQDFMSISAVRSPEVQELFSRAIDGELSKSQFVDDYMAAPHLGRNHKKAKGAKNAVYHADLLERHFGWIWR